MIDIEKARKEFDDYTKNYDLNNENLNRKYYHTYRVMGISKAIAKSLKLSNEEINLAEIIGLLHDIARFEQFTKYHTFADSISVDHGDLGVEILTKENYIRKFIETDEYDNIIIKAIKNHNKYQIGEGLTEQELMYAKIIRDADKLDIYYETLTLFYKKDEEKQEIENGIITDYIMNQIKKEKQILKSPNPEAIDRLLVNLCFVFDLNFNYSFKLLQEKEYINKIIDRFRFSNEETRNQIEQIRQIINKYIQKKG